MRSGVGLGVLIAALALLGARSACACGWDNESYAAEAQSLPCVFDVVLDTYPKHSKEYYRARIAAADALLEWAPAHLDALDMKGIALLKLGRLPEAEVVMLRRAELAPSAYASHANLGTLYTFMGKWLPALAEIDRALGIEPRAHFGREKYHRLLVEYLRDLEQDATLALRKDFLGLALSPEKRLNGSPEVFEQAGAQPDVFDALVAMIAVYGAERVPHVFLALGEALALHGDRRLAWTAYQRAVELKHPRSSELKTWQKAISDALEAEYNKDPKGWFAKIPETDIMALPDGQGVLGEYAGLRTTYQVIAKDASDPLAVAYRARARQYTAWEIQQIKLGLPVWREEGLSKLYAKANELRPRCKSPGVVFNEPGAPSPP